MKFTPKLFLLVALCLLSSSCQALFTESSPNSANIPVRSGQVVTAESADNPPRRVGLISGEGVEVPLDDYSFLFPLTGKSLIALAREKNAHQWCFVSPDGSLAFETRFHDAGHFGEGLAPVQVEGKYGFINTSGELVIEPSFAAIEYTAFHDGRCAVSNEDKERGFIDRTGDMVIPYSSKLASVRQFEGERIHYPDEGKEVFLDLEGQVAFSTSHKGPFRYGEDYWTFTKDGLVGYLDASGEAVIEAKYQEALPFDDGFAAVKVDGVWGLIDKSGRVKVKPSYQEARSPHEQHFAAKSKGKWGFVALDGTAKTAFAYDDVGWVIGDVFAFRSGEKWGLAKLDGTEIVEPKYKELLPWGDSENYTFSEE